MEAKLKCRDFTKCFLIDNTNPGIAFSQLKTYVDRYHESRPYKLFWQDSEGDYINFTDIDGFAIALSLNQNKIVIHVCVQDDNHPGEVCSRCKGPLNPYLYHCLGCADVVLCHICIKRHQSESGHFSILEKAGAYQIHPFLYRQLQHLVERPPSDLNVTHICTFFQKVVIKHGIGIANELDSLDDTKNGERNSLKEMITLYNNISMRMPTINERSYEDSDDEDIDVALNKMMNMGFVNADNCVRDLLVRFNGNIPTTLDYMNREMVNNNS